VESRSLSRTEARVVLTLEAAGQERLDLGDIRRLAKVSPGFARKLAHDLVRKGWIQRTRRGEYVLNPSSAGPDPYPDLDPLRIGSHLAAPYYFGYGTAAELHGLLQQPGRVYYVVTPRRVAARSVGTSRIQPIRTSRERMFGRASLTRRGNRITVSDLERTLVDCLDRPDLSGGMSGVAHAFALAKPRLNWDRLSRYLRRMESRSLQLRLGYLTERVRPSVRAPAGWVERWLPFPASGYVPLAPARRYGRRGPHDARWHVVRNVPDRELFAEGEIP
jgi:predicted transcriptional regulator of viral defense system